AHDMGDQFRPAFAPWIARYFGTVGIANETTDFLGPLGDTAVYFAGTKYRVRGPALAGTSMNVAGRRQIDRDAARNAAQRLAPTDNAGDRLFIHAVLQRHHKPIRRQILSDQRRGPWRIV